MAAFKKIGKLLYILIVLAVVVSVPVSAKTSYQTYTYSYDVFIPKHFRGLLVVGAKFQITSEEGVTDEFTIQGIDDMNRKYIEVWG